MFDYLIVGQGIAGSMLSWFLLQQNQKVLVIDRLNPSSATNVASGITNPITGRRFVKSWLADEIIPFAAHTYQHFENSFRHQLLSPLSIIKIFDSVMAQNDWSTRCATSDYRKYLKNDSVIKLDNSKVKNDYGGFEITGGSRLDAERFLSLYRNYLSGEGALLDERFSFPDLKVETESVSYKSWHARKIIFCEGAEAVNNPYFKFLPFQLAKGECLIVRIKDFYRDSVINGEVFIMPMEKDELYYIGATHEWHFDDALPSEKGKNELLGNLASVLNAPFEIVEHKAAIRPTVKDRRPFVGFHPEYTRVGIFNGMGTKGISLAPYFAHHFVQHLVEQEPLMKEVDIQRFS